MQVVTGVSKHTENLLPTSGDFPFLVSGVQFPLKQHALDSSEMPHLGRFFDLFTKTHQVLFCMGKGISNWRSLTE